MRAAAKCARDAANFVDKGKLDAHARHAQERITSAGQKVSVAQRSVLKFEERRKELEQQLKIAGFNCDAAVQEHERLVVESLKVVPSNPFLKYSIMDSCPPNDYEQQPMPCVQKVFYCLWSNLW